MRRKLIYLAGLLALCALPLRADDVRVARAAVDAELARYETVLDQAEQRYRAVFVGKIKTRGGRDVPERTILRPIERARERLALQKRAIAALQERVGSDSAPLSAKDFGRAVDEKYVGITKIVWEVHLVEAKKKVVLLQQMYDRETRALREQLSRGGAGAKAEVKRRETALKTRVLERFDQVATRLARQRGELLGWLRQYADAAKAAGRTHTEPMIKRLFREEFSLSDDTGSPSSLRIRLDFSTLILGSIVGGESRSLKLADAIRGEPEPTERELEEITLGFRAFDFDRTPAAGPGVEEGGLVVLNANLYPADLDVYETEVSVERGGRTVWKKKVNLRRVGDQGWKFRSKLMRVAGGAEEPVVGPDDPAGGRLIEAKIGDQIVVSFRDQRQRITVREARARLRYVRIVDDEVHPVTNELLFGVPYWIEARFLRYQDDGNPELEMEWQGPGRDGRQGRERILMTGIGPQDSQGRYARFRSTRYFVLDDRNRPSEPVEITPASPATGGTQNADWFIGTWQVGYSDSLFNGGVKGIAHVSRPGQNQSGLEISIVLENPISHKRYHLKATHVEISDDRVTMTLRGQSPSRSATYDGRTDLRQWGTNDMVLWRVRPGAVITSKLVGLRAELSAQPGAKFPIENEVKLDLRRASKDSLAGTWSYTYGEQGMYGRRAGRRQEHTVSSIESWARVETQ